jgi:hypothetical protein
VKRQFSIQKQSFRKAILLLSVYVLHLVFFQALMQAAPAHNIDSSYKTLFSQQNNHISHSIPAAKHPAVTYYSMLIKQGNSSGNVCIRLAPVMTECEAVVTPFFLAITYHINQTSVGQLHWADDVFKVYRLIRVFLI